jgi:hypothetical protein
MVASGRGGSETDKNQGRDGDSKNLALDAMRDAGSTSNLQVAKTYKLTLCLLLSPQCPSSHAHHTSFISYLDVYS